MWIYLSCQHFYFVFFFKNDGGFGGGGDTDEMGQKKRDKRLAGSVNKTLSGKTGAEKGIPHSILLN